MTLQPSKPHQPGLFLFFFFFLIKFIGDDTGSQNYIGPPVDECIKKLWYIYSMEYYSARKKKMLPFATAWMGLESIMLSEIRQSEKHKYHVISLICGT